MARPEPIPRETLERIVQGAYVPCLVHEKDGWHARWRTADGARDAALDAFVRRAALTPSTQDAETRRFDTLADAWIAALRSRTGLVKGDEAELAAFARELEEWNGAAQVDVAARAALVFTLFAAEDRPFTLSIPVPKGRAALRALGQAAFVFAPLKGLRRAPADPGLLATELTVPEAEAFARTGVMHVFAISGLHVGFAAAILYFALTVLRVPWRYQAAAGLPILFLYVCACGGRPSAMRAFSMVALVWIASLLGRGAKPIDSLVLAATVSLALFPRDLGDAGFALSYCIAASIFVYSLPLFALLERRFEPRVLYGGFMRRTYSRLRRGAFGFFVGGACISFGCAMAAFPLSAHYFGYASLLSALYSPLFVFAAGVAVSLGFAGFFLPAFLAQWLNAAACAVVWAMDWGAMRINSLADMAVDFTLPSGFAAALAAVGFLAASDWLGRILPQWAGFVLAPLAAAALIFLYKIAF